MKHGMKNMAALLACLAFAALPVLTVGAQIIGKDLPKPRLPYTPHSALFKATLETITADADRFMSVVDFGAVTTPKWFIYGGVDESLEDGINLGFGTKFGEGGRSFFGVAYGGNLISDLAKLITNQSAAGYKLEIKDESNVTTPKLLDNKNNEVSIGESISNHNLYFLIGRGIFGAKIGFSEYAKGVVDSYTLSPDTTIYLYSLENSLKPSLEVGLNVGDRVRFKPALRGAFDYHQVDNTHYDDDKLLAVIHEKKGFLEPSGGITLGVDFGGSENTQMEVTLIADAALRMYFNDGERDLVSKNIIGGASPNTWTTSSVTDLRFPGSIGFTYRRNLNEKFTLGFKTKIDGKFEKLSISQKPTTGPAEPDKSETTISAAPDVAAGVSYILYPDHFALHGGLGLKILSFDMTTGEDDKTIEIGMPTVRLALGMTLNFTKNTAFDLLVATRNVAELPTNTGFTMLFTVKK